MFDKRRPYQSSTASSQEGEVSLIPLFWTKSEAVAAGDYWRALVNGQKVIPRILREAPRPTATEWKERSKTPV